MGKFLFLPVFLFIISCMSAQYVEVGPFSGAVSDKSAVIIYKLSIPNQKCRVAYSTDSLLGKPEFSDLYTTSEVQANYIKVLLKKLEPDTRYFYQLELNGVILERSRGKFRTFSDTSKSFTFAFGNSLRTETERSGLMAAIENDILFFLNTGDLHYDDIGIADVGLFRNSYQKTFLRKDMAKMGKTVPFVFIWDDHDYGPNNSDKNAPGRLQSGKAYRECIPHYTLNTEEKNGAIYQAFNVNNTRFILTDLRSKRDKNSKLDNEQKTMMGKEQLTWFLKEIKASSLKYPLVIWVSSVPFTAEKKEGGDNWNGFTHERRIIANFVKKHSINNLMIISGDAHSISFNIGMNNNYSDYDGGGLFEILAAPLDNYVVSRKGGPWTEVYLPEKGQMIYGMVEVDYFKKKTTVRFKSFDSSHKELIQAEKTFYNTIE